MHGSRKSRKISTLGVICALTLSFISLINPVASAEPLTDPTVATASSGLSVAQQQQNCRDKAAPAKPNSEYQCATVAKDGQSLEEKKASQLRAADSLARRNTDNSRSIAPDCDEEVSNPNRWVSCSSEGWVISNTTTVNGVTTVVGTMDVSFLSSVEFNEGSGGTSWVIQTDLTVTDTWGTLQGGVSGSMWTGCLNHNDKCTSSELAGSNKENEPASFLPFSVTSKYYTQYVATMPVGSAIQLWGNLGSAAQFNTPAGSVTIADHESNTLWGRCDNYSNNFNAGCVDDEAPSFVVYNVNDNPKVEGVANHVFVAIGGLPSHWGNPIIGVALTRLTDDDQADENRKISCSGIDPSCDEYPIAHSYEGGDGAARTDRSTATVSVESNNSQGGLTRAYFDLYRVLDRDPFWVQTVLKDGSTAW